MLSAISTERCSSVVLVRRTRPEVGASPVGSDMFMRQLLKGVQEVKVTRKSWCDVAHQSQQLLWNYCPTETLNLLGKWVFSLRVFVLSQ